MNIINKILAVYEAGRKVDMKQIMKHELIPVPVSISLYGTSSINGQAFVVALEKPQECPIFKDLADVFVDMVHNKGKHFERQDTNFQPSQDNKADIVLCV